MIHDLDWVQRVAEGYEAACTCGRRFVHGARDSVLTLHEQHTYVEDLRVSLNNGKGDRGEDS